MRRTSLRQSQKQLSHRTTTTLDETASVDFCERAHCACCSRQQRGQDRDIHFVPSSTTSICCYFDADDLFDQDEVNVRTNLDDQEQCLPSNDSIDSSCVTVKIDVGSINCERLIWLEKLETWFSLEPSSEPHKISFKMVWIGLEAAKWSLAFAGADQPICDELVETALKQHPCRAKTNLTSTRCPVETTNFVGKRGSGFRCLASGVEQAVRLDLVHHKQLRGWTRPYHPYNLLKKHPNKR